MGSGGGSEHIKAKEKWKMLRLLFPLSEQVQREKIRRKKGLIDVSVLFILY